MLRGMPLRTSSPWALGALLVLTGCGFDGTTTPEASPYRAALEQLEQAAQQRPIAYADFRSAPHFDPVDGYVEDGVLWAYAHRQPRQRGLALGGPTATTAAWLERDGPLGTRRCASWSSAGPGRSVCVGEHEPGGLRGFGSEAPTFGLPARGGYLDLALSEARQQLWVLDTVQACLHVLARDGRLLGRIAVPPTSQRIGMLGDGHLFVLGAAEPRLSVYALSADGTAAAPVVALARRAPLRDASYDAARELLWLVGPEDQAVRRNRGPIEHLGSMLWALDAAELRQGRRSVVLEWALQPRGLCDATRVVATPRGVWVSATGSDRALWVQGTRASFTAQQLNAGLAPAGAVATPEGLAALSRLDDSLRLYAPDDHGDLTLRTTRALDRATRTTLADLGERLFYGALLWRQRQDARFTCNSCHWDGGTDHRLQPGFHEKRQELTRPLGGIAGVLPIFTPGQAPNLTLAVEGLLRSLDERMWQAEPPPRYWDYPVELPLADGSRRHLAPLEVRSALLEFLLQLPAEPGHLRAAREPALQAGRARGAALFVRDCARCHEPVTNLHTRQRVADPELLTRLESQPLVLGAAAFAEAGAGPSFTPAGNRISPLMNLSRGGPYFASGSARSLAELLERFTPGSTRCHGGSGTPPAYDAAQRADLEVFLRSL